MSERERWIVYPLMFLAIGASLKDKFVPSDIKADSIECNRITCRKEMKVNNLICSKAAVDQSLIRDLQSRQVTIIDKAKKPRVVMRTVPDNGPAERNADREAGQINLFDSTGTPVCALGRIVICDRLLVTNRAETTRLVANAVGVVDGTGETRVILRTQGDKAQAGDEKGKAAMGRIELIGTNGRNAVTLAATSDGGFVAASHGKRRGHLLLSHGDAGAGLFFLDGDGAAQAIAAVSSEVIQAQPKIGAPADEPQPSADGPQPPGDEPQRSGDEPQPPGDEPQPPGDGPQPSDGETGDDDRLDETDNEAADAQ